MISRYDQKLEHILRAAARIFAGKGYHSTTMRDIARATDVSLAGLYYYCESKEELLFLIQEHCFGRVLERLELCLQDTREPVEKLRVFVENHLSFFAANQAEMKVLSHEAESLGGDMRVQVAEKKYRYTQIARGILLEVGHAAPDDRQLIDVTVATYALFGMMNWIYNWYDVRGKLDVTALVDNITRLFLSGFVGDTGIAATALSALDNETLNVWRSAPES